MSYYKQNFPSVSLKLQKQPTEVFYKNRCSLKFHKIHRKRFVPESLFNKATGSWPTTLLKRGFWYRCFPVNFVKFQRISFSQNSSKRLLLKFVLLKYFHMLHETTVSIHVDLILVKVSLPAKLPRKIFCKNFMQKYNWVNSK